ncbi:Brix domain-containing protein [Zopfochytrium polystomum]|nr:Brix domain-containing protein [Zopfochytrium polystomum]
MSALRFSKPRTAASKRALQEREPKVIEEGKNTLFVRGATTSETVMDTFKDLYALRRPKAILFNKRNDVHPFEDTRPIEFFSLKNDASLIVLANHSKKRPHNLTVIRTFDYQILDIVEFGIVRALPSAAFDGPKPGIGQRPVMLFQGDLFEVNEDFKKIKNVLMDLFRASETSDLIDLKGLDHVVSVSVDDKAVIHLRSYMVTMLRSGSKLPRVELEDCGPSVEMIVRRTRFGDEAVYKLATKVPKELRPKNVKNIERDVMGDKMGRIHMHTQDFAKLQTRKMKGLKRSWDGGDENEEDDESKGGAPAKRAK